MIKPKRGSKNRSSSEMVVPFSLDETLEIIESVQAQNRMFRHLTVTIDEHEDELIVFRVRFNLINVFGIGRFDCYGELNGNGAYNTTTLQWLPSKIYRKSDFLFGSLLGVGFVLLAVSIMPLPLNTPPVFLLVFLLMAVIVTPINRMAHRNGGINYIRKQVETRLFDAMNANLGDVD